VVAPYRQRRRTGVHTDACVLAQDALKAARERVRVERDEVSELFANAPDFEVSTASEHRTGPCRQLIGSAAVDDTKVVAAPIVTSRAGAPTSRMRRMPCEPPEFRRLKGVGPRRACQSCSVKAPA
jgi:hypothetical protein